MMKWYSLLLACMLIASGINAATIHVPADQPTIQAGIDSASNGDTVLVATGTYIENILFNGQDIKVLSSGGAEVTFLEPATAGTIVSFNNGEGLGCVFAGFTLQNSGASSALDISASAPTIRNNIFTNNREGGWNSPSVVTIHADASPSVHHNLFHDNGGLASVSIGGRASFYNNTIVDPRRYGINVSHDTAIVVNNIIIHNGQNGIIGSGLDGSWVDYNNVFDPGSPIGPNGTSVDPLFEYPTTHDYRLQYLSPCINAGVPDPQFNEPDGTPSDMGAFPWIFDPPAPVNMTIDSGTLIPTFWWSYVDTVITTQQSYEIEVGTDRDWGTGEMWSSGQVPSTDTFATYAGSALSDRGLYYLRVRLDNGSHWGSWVEGRFAVQIDQFQVIQVPGDLPVIQDAIDVSLAGDTIRVADGTYTGVGNRDLDFWGKNIVLESVNGPEVTIIDCQGSQSEQHRGFYIHYEEDSTCVIDGFTVTNAYDEPDASDPYFDKAAIYCRHTSPTIQNCLIIANTCCGIYHRGYGDTTILRITGCTISYNTGFAGVWIDYAPAYIAASDISFNIGHGAFISTIHYPQTEVTNSLFWGNGSAGLYITQSMDWRNIYVSNCTFVDNNDGFVAYMDFPKGNPVSSRSPSPDSSEIYNNIFAFNTDLGIDLSAAYFDQKVFCNNSFGNPGGDFVGDGFTPGDTFGNLSLDPLFCDTATGDFTIAGSSPCAPANNSCGILMGAFGVGCECCELRGDVDRQGDINVGDVTYLVAYLFQSGPPPPCPEEGDVDGSGSTDVGDLTFLVAYLFQGGGPPLPCP